MTGARQSQLEGILYDLLPGDCSGIGNQELLEQFQKSARRAGLKAGGEVEFKVAREALRAKIHSRIKLSAPRWRSGLTQ